MGLNTLCNRRAFSVSCLTLIGLSWGCEPSEECFDAFRYTHCVSEGIHYQDHELFVDRNSSMEMCHDSCQATPECEHASYDSMERICFGRSRKSAVFFEDNPYIYTIPKICIPGCSIDATDFPGNDIEIRSDIKDHLVCQQHCQANPDCIASVWTQPWNSYDAYECHLKEAMPLSNKRHHNAAMVIAKYCLEQFRIPDDFYYFQNIGYKFFAQTKSFSQAYYFCENVHGSLVSLETSNKYAFIRSAVFQLNFFNSTVFSGNYQIGLRIHVRTNQKWKWVSGAFYNEDDDDDLDIWCSNPSSTYSSAFLDVEGSCIKEAPFSTSKANVICEFTGCLGLNPPNVQNARTDYNDADQSHRYCGVYQIVCAWLFIVLAWVHYSDIGD